LNWQAAIRFLSDQPWHAVFGVGYKTLPYSNVTGRPLIVDNMYLSMLVETGVVGLVALLALSAAILRTGWRAARHSDAAASFFGTWILCFWAGQIVQMLSGDLLTYWRVLPVYFWVLGTARASSR
jgi:O-antigen ligase